MPLFGRPTLQPNLRIKHWRQRYQCSSSTVLILEGSVVFRCLSVSCCALAPKRIASKPLSTGLQGSGHLKMLYFLNKVLELRSWWWAGGELVRKLNWRQGRGTNPSQDNTDRWIQRNCWPLGARGFGDWFGDWFGAKAWKKCFLESSLCGQCYFHRTCSKAFGSDSIRRITLM